jgi:hypothetical protein
MVHIRIGLPLNKNTEHSSWQLLTWYKSGTKPLYMSPCDYLCLIIFLQHAPELLATILRRNVLLSIIFLECNNLKINRLQSVLIRYYSSAHWICPRSYPGLYIVSSGVLKIHLEQWQRTCLKDSHMLRVPWCCVHLRSVHPFTFFSVSAVPSTHRGPCRSEAPSTARAAPATTNRLLAEPGGSPGVNCAWVKVIRGRTVGGCIVKAPMLSLSAHVIPGVSDDFRWMQFIQEPASNVIRLLLI